MEEWVLEQKKEFWGMVQERKDLEHDLGLIETNNMKIQCKNNKHDRAWQIADRAHQFKE